MCRNELLTVAEVAAVADERIKPLIRSAFLAHQRSFAVLVAGIAEYENRGLLAADGLEPRHLSYVVQQLTRQSMSDCRQQVKVARLTTRRPAGGSSFADPELPATAAGMADGEIGPGHVREIVKAMAPVPRDWEERSGVEEALARLARTEYPEDIKRFAKLIADRVEQEFPPPADDDDDRLTGPDRRLSTGDRSDGGLWFKGVLDKETALELKAFLTAFAQPHKDVGEPDLRGPQRRQGDALAELIHHGVTCGTDPDEDSDDEDAAGKGKKNPAVQMTVTLSWEDLAADVRRIIMTGYGVISPEAARRMACDAQIIPAVLNGKSLPLDIGTKTRSIPTGIRRALILRDWGCAFPGCTRPGVWTDAHHIWHWRYGGPTKLGNLVLLCHTHHRIIHHSKWSVVIRQGIPYFIPPAYIDPSRTPIRHARYSMKC